MRKIKQNTAKNVMVLMVDSTDHVTGKTSLTLTITASKDGAVFASITPIVTERGTGWYNLALTATHTNTLGDLALHITGTAADPADLVLLVEAGSTDADVSTRSTFAGGAVASVTGSVGSVVGLTVANLDATISSRSTYAGGAVASVTAAVTLPAIPANWITAAGVNAAALNGKGDWNVGKTGYSVSAMSAGLINATVAPNLDAAVSTRSTYAGGAVTSVTGSVGSVVGLTVGNLDAAVSSRMATFVYTTPDNASITAIKASTDNLPAAPAAVSDIPSAVTNANAVWNKVLP